MRICYFLLESTTSGGITVSKCMVLCVCSYICIFKQGLILYYSDEPLVTGEFVLLVYSLPVLCLLVIACGCNTEYSLS